MDEEFDTSNPFGDPSTPLTLRDPEKAQIGVDLAPTSEALEASGFTWPRAEGAMPAVGTFQGSLPSVYDPQRSLMDVYSPGAESGFTGILDDKTAGEYYAELEGIDIGANPGREKELEGALRNYEMQAPLRERRAQELKTSKAEEQLASLYTDSEAFKKLSDNPLVRAREDLAINPNHEKMRLVNKAFLESKLGIKIGNDAEYEMARDKYSRSNDGVPLPSDQQFFQTRQKEYEQGNIIKDANNKLLGRGFKQIAADAAQGKPTEFTELVDGLAKEIPELEKSPEYKARAVAGLNHLSMGLAGQTAKIRPQIAKAWPIIQRLTQSQNPDDIVALSKILDEVSEQDQQKIIAFATHAATVDLTPDQRNTSLRFLENIGKGFVQEMTGIEATGSITNQEDALEKTQLMLRNGQAVVDAQGNIRFPTGGGVSIGETGAQTLPAQQRGYVTTLPEGRALTPEETAKFNDRIETAKRTLLLQRQIRSVAIQEWDPVKEIGGDTIFGKYVEPMAYGTARIAGQLAPSALLFLAGGPIRTGLGLVGIAGKSLLGRAAVTAASQLPTTAYSFKSNYESILNNLILKDPHGNREQMKQYASVTAAVMAPFDLAELGVLTNRFPGLKNMVRNMVGGKLVSSLGHLAGSTGVEIGAENIQNFAENLSYRLYETTKEDKIASGDAWSKAAIKAWDDTREQMFETSLAMFPFAMVGSGIAHLEDLGKGQREALIARMTDPEAMRAMGFSEAQINSVQARVDPVDRASVYREEFEKRDLGTMRAAEAENVRRASEERAAATAVHEDDAMPTMSQRILDDGKVEYTITSPAGKAYTTTDQVMADRKMREQIALVENQRAKEEEAIKTGDEGIAAVAEDRMINELLGEEAAAVPPAEPGKPPPPPATVPVHVFDDSAKEFTVSEMPPTKDLFRKLKVEEGIYKKVQECLLS